MAFYRPAGHGASWQLTAVVPIGRPAGQANALPVTVSPHTWLTVSMDTRQVVTVTDHGAHLSAVRISGLPGGGLVSASFTSTRSGWVVIDAGKCLLFKADCTQTTSLYVTTDGGAHWVLRISSTAPA